MLPIQLNDKRPSAQGLFALFNCLFMANSFYQQAKVCKLELCRATCHVYILATGERARHLRTAWQSVAKRSKGKEGKCNFTGSCEAAGDEDARWVEKQMGSISGQVISSLWFNRQVGELLTAARVLEAGVKLEEAYRVGPSKITAMCSFFDSSGSRFLCSIVEFKCVLLAASDVLPTLGAIPASCLICWLSLAVFLAMLWVLRRLILSLIVRVSVFLYLSATTTE